MKIKFFILFGFILLFVLLLPQKTEALMVADGYIVGAPRKPPNPPPPPPRPPGERYSKDKEGNVISPATTPEYYQKTTLQDGTTIYTPNDKLKTFCASNSGCEQGTILARYTAQYGTPNVAVVNSGNPYGSTYALSGTSGNQYIANSAQQGVAGFYQAPNGGWYPIGVPPPPRNPGEPFARNPADPTPEPTQFMIIVTLTPTPTPYLGPWPKLKDSSYVSRFRVQSTIPNSPIAYDSDDTTQPHFIIGDGGVVISRSISLTSLNSNAKASTKDWKFGNYSDMLPPTLTPSDYELYVRGRKEHKDIDSLNEIDGDGIYSLKSTADLNIDSVPAAFNLYNVVLIAHGTVNINVTNSFNPSKSVAIVAPIVNFSPQTTDASGIFIANVVNTGSTTNQGLKINGNLIAQDTFNIQRRWSNLNRPTIFVVFKPEIYLDLLPYLSVASYNWQQQQ